MGEKTAPEQTLTEEEAELYDRQIRLWGLDSQKRLRQARILISGMGSLGVEIAKNVILAGVKSMILMDNVNVTVLQMVTNFGLTEKDVGKNRAIAVLPNIQKLNPMVTVTTDTANIDDKPDDFFSEFDVVCVLGCSQETAKRVDSICHKKKIHFLAGDCFGFYGYGFFDFGTHEYSEEVPQKPKKSEDSTNVESDNKNEPAAKKRKVEPPVEEEKVMVKKSCEYITLEKALKGKDTTKRSPAMYDLLKILWQFRDSQGQSPEPKMDEDKMNLLKDMISKVDKSLQSKPSLNLDNIIEHTTGEFAPTCAIVGGIMGQEVIKAVSQKDAPLNNFFLFDGTEGSGYVQEIKS